MSLDDIRQDVRETKDHVFELVKQGSVHNELLRQHEARSLALQAEQERIKADLKPVIRHVQFVEIFLKLTGAIVVGVVIQWVVRHLL